MLLIAQRFPIAQFFNHVRHIAQQTKQHDGLVEDIQIVSRKACRGHDIGFDEDLRVPPSKLYYFFTTITHIKHARVFTLHLSTFTFQAINI